MRIDKDLVAASATPLVLGILADGDLFQNICLQDKDIGVLLLSVSYFYIA